MNTDQTNKPMTVAVLRSGLLPTEILAEMQHWGMPVAFVQEGKVLDTKEEVVECIRDAIEGDGTVKIRDTDLDALATYLKTHEKGHLVVWDPDAKKTKRVSCTYAVLPNGRYVIPWTAEDISDLLTDPRSYLYDIHHKHIVFEDVEELFFGGRKAFISARPATEAP